MPQSSPKSKTNNALVALIVIVLIGAGVGAVYWFNNNQGDADSSSTEQTVTPPDNRAGTNESNYRNGTYSADGSYRTPGGPEDITVTVTLENGIVTSAEAGGTATEGNSAQFQDGFFSEYKNEVVGRSIDDVRLSRVAGSSLTSAGFNQAIDTIKNDAAL